MSAKAGSANLITGTRILCSIALLFCQTFSPPFFALYIILNAIMFDDELSVNDVFLCLVGISTYVLHSSG